MNSYEMPVLAGLCVTHPTQVCQGGLWESGTCIKPVRCRHVRNIKHHSGLAELNSYHATGVRSQKSEVRGQRSEVRGQRSAVSPDRCPATSDLFFCRRHPRSSGPAHSLPLRCIRARNPTEGGRPTALRRCVGDASGPGRPRRAANPMSVPGWTPASGGCCRPRCQHHIGRMVHLNS